MEIAFPDWHNGRPVYCFFDPEFSQFGMTYSWDENACNASMFRNGVNGEYAEHLPHWDWDDDGDFLQVVKEMTGKGYLFRLAGYRTTYRITDEPFKPEKVPEHLEYESEFMPIGSNHAERYIARAESAPKAVCLAAVRAIDGKIKPKPRLTEPQ